MAIMSSQNSSSKPRRPTPTPSRDQSAGGSENDNNDSQRDNIGQTDGNITPVTNYCPPPKGISEAMWERFQLLRERKQKLSSEQHSRQRTRKRKQKKQTDGDTETSSDSGQHDSTQLTPLDTHLSNKLRSHDTTRCVDAGGQDSDPRLSWVNVRPYLGVNDHLKGVAQGRHAAKTKLEKKIDKAISLQDFDTAEKLSDHLATREFGKEVADAFTAKRYAEKKTKEEDTIKARKKKKLDWGFDHKQRWETKGNM